MNLKYGERFNLYRWSTLKKYQFRFRMEPVQWTGKHFHFKNWYKTPFMRKRERSLSFEHKDYIRPKKNLRNLYDPWDDIPRSDIRNSKSWKNKKIKKQWMKNKK